MGIILIPLKDEDDAAKGFAALEVEFVGTYPWFDQWLATTRTEVAAGLRDLYGIYADETLAGVFLVNRVDATTIKANAMVIWSEFRGRGISIAAYHELFRLHEGTAECVFTQCKAGNVIARRLIDRVGFVQIGTLLHLIENSTDNLVFVRTVRSGVSWESCLEKARDIYTEPNVKQFLPFESGEWTSLKS